MPGESQTAAEPITLVIGYGDERSGDAAAGPLVAREIQRWRLPHVAALAARELGPDLAPRLAEAAGVVFVTTFTARSASAEVPIRVHALAPYSAEQAAGRAGDPRALLALTAAAYGRRPRAWWVKIPAYDYGPGGITSRLTQRGMRAALRRIFTLVSPRGNPAP